MALELAEADAEDLAPIGPGNRRRRIVLAGAALGLTAVAAALVATRAADTDDAASVLAGADDPPSPLFGAVEQVVPEPLPDGWARCDGGRPAGHAADVAWSQTFGPVVDGSCQPLVTVTQLPPDGSSEVAIPASTEDGKLGDADVSQWSDPDRGAEGLVTWAFDQNLLVEACCGPDAGEHVRAVAAAALDDTRQRAPAHCTDPSADLAAEDLITNLTGKVRRVVDERGCPIRTDIASMETYGPEAHCWAGVTFARIGTPFGATMTDESGRTYVRDDSGALDDRLAGALQLDAELPATARSTGYSRDGRTMWVDDADGRWLYIDAGDHLEAWPLLAQPIGCA